MDITLITNNTNSSMPIMAYMTADAFLPVFLLYAVSKNQLLSKLSTDARKNINGKRIMYLAGLSIAKNAIIIINTPITMCAISMIVPSFLGE